MSTEEKIEGDGSSYIFHASRITHGGKAIIPYTKNATHVTVSELKTQWGKSETACAERRPGAITHIVFKNGKPEIETLPPGSHAEIGELATKRTKAKTPEINDSLDDDFDNWGDELDPEKWIPDFLG